MKIPKELKVGGRVYKVLYPHVFVETNFYGLANHVSNTISIAARGEGGESVANENIEQTFLHELLHCVDVVYNNHDLTEDVVTRLAEGLYQVLKDNKLLAEGTS